LPNWTPEKIVKGYIVNTETGEQREFQFNPNALETINESIWEDTDARNTHPHQEWKGSKATLSFPLRFMRRPGYDANGTVVWLRELTKPRMRNGKLVEPPVCLVVIGSGSWEVRVRKVTVNYLEWKPSGGASGFDVTIECAEWKNVPKPPEEKKAKQKKPSKSEQRAQERPYAYLLEQK